MQTYCKPTLSRLGTFREVTRHKTWGPGDILVYIKWKEKKTVS